MFLVVILLFRWLTQRLRRVEHFVAACDSALSEMMSNVSFAGDPFSRKVTRFLLVLQIAAMVIVVGLSLVDLFFLALAISLLTFVIFVASLLLLYARYREIPIVREKRELERFVNKFQRGILSEKKIIQAANTERASLFESEKQEISTALNSLQWNHIEMGLAMASIQDAAISGVEPKLKERLAGYGILSAAELTEKISDLPGFGEAKHRALMDWRGSVIERLESTKPNGLPEKQLEGIRQKYQALQNTNNAAERKSRTSVQILEHELMLFRPRLRQLAPFTFVRYLSKSLASRGIVAAPLALVLIMTQVVSSVSATAGAASSIISSLPTPTAVPTRTMVPTTATPFIARMSTATPSPTGTMSPTSTPSQTETPTLTLTSTPTSTPMPTFTSRPSNTSYIPVSGGGDTSNCDPAYPGVCIPPPPPDLDCPEIPYRRFQVLPPDPHNFDLDADGIGCES
jgi:ABC-type multidrug transport system fused ATPase/permease subunit